ncbi:hypothetical protein ABZ671_14475 [Micromonospora sp. NPDC006766]
MPAAERHPSRTPLGPQLVEQRLAERESRQSLGAFFDAWLYRTGKPVSW